MRGLLLGLLLANILYVGLAFALKVEVAEDDNLLTGEESASKVQLISEVDPSQLLSYPRGLGNSRAGDLFPGSSQSIELSPRPFCAEVGGFESLEDANDFIAANAAKIRAALDVRQLAAKSQYRVYLPPFEGREAAVDAIEQLGAALAANNVVIDSFLIPQGELANGIALGLFSEQANAANVKLQLENIGYDVMVKEVQNTRQELKVLIGELESEAIFQGYWVEIQRTRPYLQAVEKLCETIAQGI
ncbi:MAG: SPOR domain-containing protein [Gammaproteobacteria bacterium]|nr:SPOR domain-containing protein [Gammaproteobacteria bacterium]